MALLGSALLLASGTFAPGTFAPAPQDEAPTLAEIDRAVAASIDYLLNSQESYVADPAVGSLPDDKLEGWQVKERKRLNKLQGKKGAAEWPYEGVYRVGRDRKIPSGYRVGGTAIVCDTLLRSGATGARARKVGEAVERSLDFIMEMIESDGEMALGPKKGYDVRGWGHAYALQLMLTVLDTGAFEKGDRAERAAAMIPVLIERLAANQTAMGGWNYASDRTVSPFMTGSTLLMLYEAQARGYEVDPAMIEQALDALEEGRTEAVSYAYSGEAARAVPMPGSSARSACAELALFKAGRSDVDALRISVTGFFEGWEDLLDRKSKQGTHKGAYGIAPYYFFFGHTYAALAIEELPEAERAAQRAELARLIWKTRDGDGSWNDRIFPRTSSYSTAMVVLALQAPTRKPNAAWSGAEAAKGK